MKISIIIVNYKVPHFLRQCLYSCCKALEVYARECNQKGEVIVFDNNSNDGSHEMCKKYFPDVKYIASSQNLGFSKANNKAFKNAKGDFILILNPDTLLPENIFTELMPYMQEHQDVGALGVQLVDANGRFHPESKRAYPTPLRAFYKLFGLAYLFPKSERFNKYQLSQISPDDLSEIEILVGAFMLIRRESAEATSLFDDSFFMYGEDIDLSYRLLKTGKRNFYYGKISALHYKGESTKIHTHRYINVFYDAMAIFVKKHFARNSRLLGFVLKTAIWFRASLAHVVLFFRNILKSKQNIESRVGEKMLLVGNEADELLLKKEFPYLDIYTIKLHTKSSSESLKFITEEIAKINADVVAFNIECYDISLFLDLMKNNNDIKFYSLANDSSCLIGEKLYVF